MDVTDFFVNGGSFKMAIVNEGKIIATVESDMFAEVERHDLNSFFSYHRRRKRRLYIYTGWLVL